MHELSIAQEIYEACRDAVASHGGGRLESVRVAVGELTAIEPDLLRFAWQAVAEAAGVAAAAIEIDWRPARQHCPECGDDKPRATGSWLRLCPDCEGPLVVEGGDELDVLQVSFVRPEEGDDG